MILLLLSASFKPVLTFPFKCETLWHCRTDVNHRKLMLYVWLTGDCVFIQRYPSNTSGIPAKETPDTARRWCKPLSHKLLEGHRGHTDSELKPHLSLGMSWHVYFRTVDSCLDTTLSHGGIHGENWPNSVLSLPTYFLTKYISFHFLFSETMFCFFFFLPATGAIQEEVVHTVLCEQEASVF